MFCIENAEPVIKATNAKLRNDTAGTLISKYIATININSDGASVNFEAYLLKGR